MPEEEEPKELDTIEYILKQPHDVDDIDLPQQAQYEYRRLLTAEQYLLTQFPKAVSDFMSDVKYLR